MYQFTNLSHLPITLGDGSSLKGNSSVLKNKVEINSRVKQLLNTGVLAIREVDNAVVRHNPSGTIQRTKTQELQRKKIIEARVEQKNIEAKKESDTGTVKVSKTPKGR